MAMKQPRATACAMKEKPARSHVLLGKSGIKRLLSM
jgi:hypothetical protein